ncbi:hypothetical protein MRB53_037393 [Persea americana]|nr:hypothetical protein MRB53_037393 [Persea americana]
MATSPSQSPGQARQQCLLPRSSTCPSLRSRTGASRGMRVCIHLRERRQPDLTISDLFAEAAKTPTLVNVAAKAYRRLALFTPGQYVATLTYNNGLKTVANWNVRDLDTVRKTKNIALFIGDGMTQNMITAARLIAHKSINGRYQTKMQMDTMQHLGHQMTHSLDSYITDSANSATALYSGRKTTVNALGCYKDSFHRRRHPVCPFLGTHNHDTCNTDFSSAALTAHTPDRGQYGAVVDSFLNGITNYSWTAWDGPDVLFGGGAEQFYNSSAAGVTPGVTYQGLNYYQQFAKKGYNVVQNKTSLLATSNTTKTLGIFTVSNMDVWLDRNVYTTNLVGNKNTPDGLGGSATDQPGLKEMTLKAVQILQARSAASGKGLVPHVRGCVGRQADAQSTDRKGRLDYDRALGDLLELDDTVRATMAYLNQTGELNNTLIIITAVGLPMSRIGQPY